MGVKKTDFVGLSTKSDHDHIAEGLRHLATPMHTLSYDPANARKHNAKNLDAIKSSLARFGQRTPIVVQAQGMVVRAGNGRLEAARELGWSHIAALVVDESSVDATAYAIADNRTGELATWDEDILAATLESLDVDGWDVSKIGFDDDDLDALPGFSIPAPKAPDNGAGVELDESCKLEVTCDTEADRDHLFARLKAEGFKVRRK